MSDVKKVSAESVEDFVENFVVPLVNAYYAANYPSLTPPVFEIKKGKRYAKIVRREASGVGGSVWGFVDVDGSLYKPASWAAPAKTARGNIFVDATKGYSPYGPDYLR